MWQVTLRWQWNGDFGEDWCWKPGLMLVCSAEEDWLAFTHCEVRQGCDYECYQFCFWSWYHCLNCTPQIIVVRVLCTNSIYDLKCVCSFRMMFQFIFLCLYISSISNVSTFWAFVFTCSISTLLLMLVYLCGLLQAGRPPEVERSRVEWSGLSL